MPAARPAIAELLRVAEEALVADARGVPAPPAPEGADPAATAHLAAAARVAIASKFLAVGTPRSIGLVGAGAAARLALEAHHAIGLPAREVRCADVDPARAARAAADTGGRATSIEEAFACDVVLATSAAAAATLEPSWLRRGTHVNAIDVAIPDHLLSGLTIVTDPAPDPPPTTAHIYATLGAIAAGIVDGRQLDEITVFLATGHPAVERAVARWAFTGAADLHVRPDRDLRS